MPLTRGRVTGDDAANPPFDHSEIDQEQPDLADPADALTPNQGLVETVQPPTQGIAAVATSSLVIPGAEAYAGREDEEFIDDDVDRWSFINVKLDDGQFQADNEPIGHEFECVILKSKPKWALRNTRCDQDDEETLFSYDGETDANTGELLADTVEEWKRNGWGHTSSQYSEKQAIMVGGDLNLEMVIINIPPTSRTRYSGRNRQFQVSKGAGEPSSYVVRCKVGEKIISGKNTYFKWKFEYVRPVEEGEFNAPE